MEELFSLPGNPQTATCDVKGSQLILEQPFEPVRRLPRPPPTVAPSPFSPLLHVSPVSRRWARQYVENSQPSRLRGKCRPCESPRQEGLREDRQTTCERSASVGRSDGSLAGSPHSSAGSLFWDVRVAPVKVPVVAT